MRPSWCHLCITCRFSRRLIQNLATTTGLQIQAKGADLGVGHVPHPARTTTSTPYSSQIINMARDSAPETRIMRTTIVRICIRLVYQQEHYKPPRDARVEPSRPKRRSFDIEDIWGENTILTSRHLGKAVQLWRPLRKMEAQKARLCYDQPRENA